MAVKYFMIIASLLLLVTAKDDCFEYNVDYDGTNINNGLDQKTLSASDCWNMCKLTLDCQGFTWASNNFPGSFIYFINRTAYT